MKARRRGLTVIMTILIAVILASAFLVHSMLTQQSDIANIQKAAIVDHLSLTYPNQPLIERTTNILRQAGYAVDYYPGGAVTIEFYRNLPAGGYKLIILRVHSTPMGTEGIGLTLFTSERYSATQYIYEQLTAQVGRVAYSLEEKEQGITYFAITPVFVGQSMRGTFQKSILLVMGCEGLGDDFMAESFVRKGAEVYIGWSGSVTASHTDLATEHLLRYLLVEKKSAAESVEETMQEVGSDPAYNSYLRYYPST